MEVNPVQLSNARSSMDKTPFGIFVFLQPKIKQFLEVSMMALQLLRESYTAF